MGLLGAFAIAKAFVSVGVDDSAVDKDMDDVKGKVSAGLGKIQSSIGGVLGAIGLGVGVAKLISESGAAIEAAQRHLDAETQRGAVLKATGEAAGFNASQLEIHATALSALTTATETDITKMQAIMLTFTQVTGSEFLRANKIVLDMVGIFGNDAKGAAIQLGKALNDPIKGVSALADVGVSFNVQQRETIRNLVEMNDLAGAQAVIMDELEAEFGGVAEALARTDAGQMKQMAAATENLQVQIGEKLIPVHLLLARVTHVVAKMFDRLLSLFASFPNPLAGVSDGTIAFTVTLAGMAAGLVGILLIVPKIIKAFSAIRKAINGMTSATGIGIAVMVAGMVAAGAAAKIITNQADKAAGAIGADAKAALAELESVGVKLPSVTGAPAAGGATSAGGGKAFKVSGADLGFGGLADFGRKIQENLLDQKKEQRAGRMLSLAEQNQETQDELLDTMKGVKSGVEKINVGVVGSTGAT